jgi:FAD/FMN-containing dehydrogenase
MATSVSDNEHRAIKRALENYEQKKHILQKEYISSLEIDSLKENAFELGLKKETSNLFRNVNIKKHTIDVRTFNNIISVDSINLVAEIEAMATYEQIVKATLEKNCLPTVVPELKSITIGGALAGIGIESSSFRYGLVHETILEYEILLGDGRIVLCRPDNEYSDLYFAFPNSYGTLGYALKVKVKLIPAKKYIKLSHIKFKNSKDYFKYINEMCDQNSICTTNHLSSSSSPSQSSSSFDYIDGVVFSKNEMYVTLGEFVDSVPYYSNYKYLNIYYLSIQKRQIDFLKTLDYIWRWDPDWFWCSKRFFMQNPVLRLLFGKFILKSTRYWKIRNFLNKNRFAQYVLKWIYGPTETVIQDVDIPIEKAEVFLDFFQKEINITPVWICPIKPYQKNIQYDFYKMDENVLYINFGFWDMISSDKDEGFYNRKIEKKVSDLDGNKSLYSNVYYPKDEFWKIYDISLYKKLKYIYDPSNRLNDLYDKCINKRPQNSR